MRMDGEAMSCAAWGSEQLLDYVQGRVPARTAGEIRSHAASCDRCRSAIEDLAALPRLDPEPLPLPRPDTEAAILGAIRIEAARRAESRPVRPGTSRIRILRLRSRRGTASFARFVAAAAAMALFVVVLSYAVSSGMRPAPAPRIAEAPPPAPPPPEDPEPRPEPRPNPRQPDPRPAPVPPSPPIQAPKPPDPAPAPPPVLPAPPAPPPVRPTEAAPAPIPEFGRVARLGGRTDRAGTALRPDDRLLSGDSVSCRGGTALLEMPDRTLILLRAGATLALSRRDYTVSLRLSEGECAFSVAPDASRRFVVESAHGTVTVKGTVFSVRATSSSATVAVAKGRVEARTDAGAVDLGAGERASMSRSTLPGRTESISVESAFGWAIAGGIDLPQTVYLAATSPQAELRAPMARSRLHAQGSLSGEPAFAGVDSRTLPGFNGRFLPANRDEGGTITFTVELRHEAEWHFWARLFFPATGTQLWKDDREPRENDPNSFYVSVDGGPERVLGNLKVDPESKASWYRRWHWGGDGSIEVGRPQALALGRLAAGRHTIRIRNRDAVETSSLRLAPRLDAICLTPEKDYRPRDEDFRK